MISDAHHWLLAYRKAESGDLTDLIALVRVYGVPDITKERHAALLLKITRDSETFKKSKRNPTVENLGAAFLHFYENVDRLGYQAAFQDTKTKYKIKKDSVLRNTLTKNRPDVNPWLRERGLLHLADKREITKFTANEMTQPIS